MLATKRETRTEVEQVVLSGFHDQSATRNTFTVYNRTSIKTAETDWTVPPERLSHWVTVERQRDGRWLVANIAATSDR